MTRPLLAAPGPWVVRAACAGMDPEVFFPTRGDIGPILTVALGVCATCPVCRPCLEYALAHPTLSGVWGATTHRDRRRMRSERRRGAA